MFKGEFLYGISGILTDNSLLEKSMTMEPPSRE